MKNKNKKTTLLMCTYQTEGYSLDILYDIFRKKVSQKSSDESEKPVKLILNKRVGNLIDNEICRVEHNSFNIIFENSSEKTETGFSAIVVLGVFTQSCKLTVLKEGKAYIETL